RWPAIAAGSCRPGPRIRSSVAVDQVEVDHVLLEDIGRRAGVALVAAHAQDRAPVPRPLLVQAQREPPVGLQALFGRAEFGAVDAGRRAQRQVRTQAVAQGGADAAALLVRASL